jgi:hypothetical protein
MAWRRRRRNLLRSRPPELCLPPRRKIDKAPTSAGEAPMDRSGPNLGVWGALARSCSSRPWMAAWSSVAPAPSSPCTRVTLPPLNLSEGPRERRPCSLTEELVSAGRLAWRPRARPLELAPVVSHGSSSWLVPGGGGVVVRESTTK